MAGEGEKEGERDLSEHFEIEAANGVVLEVKNALWMSRVYVQICI